MFHTGTPMHCEPITELFALLAWRNCPLSTVYDCYVWQIHRRLACKGFVISVFFRSISSRQDSCSAGAVMAQCTRGQCKTPPLFVDPRFLLSSSISTAPVDTTYSKCTCLSLFQQYHEIVILLFVPWSDFSPLTRYTAVQKAEVASLQGGPKNRTAYKVITHVYIRKFRHLLLCSLQVFTTSYFSSWFVVSGRLAPRLAGKRNFVRNTMNVLR